MGATMTKSYPVTRESRAASLTAVLRSNPPRLRLTAGMAATAKKLEKAADKRAK